MTAKEEVMLAALRDEANQLERWADESERGGWSTHQVQPMRDRATYLWGLIGRMTPAPDTQRF